MTSNARDDRVACTTRRSDPDLIEACLAGEARAWGTVVDRYARLVYSIPIRYGLGDAEAEDIVQDVFTIAFRRLASLRDRERLSAWLITTAHRESWRAARKRGAETALPEQLPAAPEPDEAMVVKLEREQLVRQGLEEIGSRCRELLTALFYDADDDYRTIAARLGMPIGSIGPTRARCFAKLAEALAGLGFEP